MGVEGIVGHLDGQHRCRLLVHEVPHVEPAVHAGGEEHARPHRVPAAAGEVRLVVESRGGRGEPP